MLRILREVAKLSQENGPLRNAGQGQFRVYLDGLHGRHRLEADAHRDKLPNCFIVGAAKSGTTTLSHTLGRHGHIFTCRPKEPKFFGPEYHRGWDWYAGLFEKGVDRRIRIDASTMYSSAEPMYLGTPRMIANYIERPKIIYLVRHPLERIVSHWRHWYGRRPDLFGPFDEILDHPRDRRLFIESSLYNERISNFRASFPNEDILCLTFEEMVSDPRETLTRVLSFLGASKAPKILDRLLPDGKFRQLNAAGTNRELVPKPEWNPDVRQRVIDAVAPDAREFLTSIGKPLDYWTHI